MVDKCISGTVVQRKYDSNATSATKKYTVLSL